MENISCQDSAHQKKGVFALKKFRRKAIAWILAIGMTLTGVNIPGGVSRQAQMLWHIFK